MGTLGAEGQTFTACLTSAGNHGCRPYMGTFVILGLSGQLHMKDWFQNGLVLRGWQSSGGRLLLPALVVEAEGIKGPTNHEVDLSCPPLIAFPAPHWVKDSETGTEAGASGGG